MNEFNIRLVLICSAMLSLAPLCQARLVRIAAPIELDCPLKHNAQFEYFNSTTGVKLLTSRGRVEFVGEPGHGVYKFHALDSAYLCDGDGIAILTAIDCRRARAQDDEERVEALIYVAFFIVGLCVLPILLAVAKFAFGRARVAYDTEAWLPIPLAA